jgi:hypothetical protein
MANPTGHYTNVHVDPVLADGCVLHGGAGTYNVTGVFNVGPFPEEDLPRLAGVYNISGLHNGARFEFSGVTCVLSGATSDFKEFKD